MKSKSSLTVAQHKSLGLYEALIECDRVIIRSNSLDELFGEVCRHVVHFGDMCAAWIGMMDVNDSRVWPQAHFGEGPSYLEYIETMLVTDLTEAQGLVRTAIRENQPIWLQDIQRDSSMATFRDWAQAHGWHSNAVLPLTTRGMPVGVLSVYSKTVGGFAAIAQKLLTQLASNISYALDFFNMMLSGVWRRSLWRRVKFVTAPCLPTIACQ